MPKQLRYYFADLLLFADVPDPAVLWDEFKVSLAEDLIPLHGERVAVVFAYRRINKILGARYIDKPPYKPYSMEEFQVFCEVSHTLILFI